VLLTLKIKILPTAEQAKQLLATMVKFNAACDYSSEIAFNEKCFTQVKLHKLTYYTIREQFQLSSQLAVRSIGKVCESYKLDKKTKRTFRPLGAIVYDQPIPTTVSPKQ
jgi:predicted transposase